MSEKPLVPKDELAELDELPEDVFRPGEIGKVMAVGLKDLIEHYMKANPKKDRLLAFLRWVPAVDLEQYLVLAIEYGADQTHPGDGKSTRRKALKIEPKDP